MIESRLTEFMVEDRRRKPMTPVQMARFYGANIQRGARIKDRILTTIGEALIGLGQWLKPENSVTHIKPAYQSASDMSA